MIMRRGQVLLLPANPGFVWLSLLGAFGLNLVLNIMVWGRAPWAPDLLAITLVFWGVNQPQRVGMGAAFALGLLMDVHQGSVLGQCALAYSVLAFLAVTIHRRLLWFTLSAQALQVFLLFAVAHALQVAVRALVGGNAPSLSLIVAPVLEALLWPVAHLVLLLPQRRAPDPDANRPL
jgi:rod shape-determining protein MreD